MRLGFDLSDPATFRGLVWLLFCIGALTAFLVFRDAVLGGAMIAAAGTISGAAGAFTVSKPKTNDNEQ